MVWNLGSVGSAVLILVDNVPTSLSGALVDMADMSRSYVEKRTGVTIGSTSISDPYRAPILHRTVADTVSQMALQGSDRGYKLGDLSVNDAGASSSNSSVADFYNQKAEDELRAIGFSVRQGRTY